MLATPHLEGTRAISEQHQPLFLDLSATYFRSRMAVENLNILLALLLRWAYRQPAPSSCVRNVEYLHSQPNPFHIHRLSMSVSKGHDGYCESCEKTNNASCCLREEKFICVGEHPIFEPAEPMHAVEQSRTGRLHARAAESGGGSLLRSGAIIWCCGLGKTQYGFIVIIMGWLRTVVKGSKAQNTDR